ncbi:lipid IV(A) 4-amino-4-deoxy-L-arabinosyltransferase [Sodalis praecaptivus]|uniref:lipid IV(A) 4-amino-4-deoxy-L-arabinosyltransferase n=1 Tax=Sodalis praecaptivus TaxID=1239307 RepID=UPI0027FBC096|nr:lipid IV(A) 4-amino-4-deoxy-L-arabinosyltransferase [Sodalis praecaptivus]CAJ0997636.1 Undecaprenyl phosphate-alpha-4-amino-4-deoxy-L-arabinose arabinosyl transferase [Sodalis praecaptivus]
MSGEYKTDGERGDIVWRRGKPGVCATGAVPAAVHPSLRGVRPGSFRDKAGIWLGLLAVFFVLTYLVPLEGRLLWQPDETRYAEISREMLASGDWTVPHLLGLRYFEKPLAGYWMNNIGQWLFGSTNFAVRFASVLSTGLSALLVFGLTWTQRHQLRQSVLSALIFLSLLLVFGVGTYSVLDPMLALWLNAAMAAHVFALRANSRTGRFCAWLVFGLACGLGFMTKGFLALVVPAIAVLPVSLYYRQFKSTLGYGALAALLAALVNLPWALRLARLEPDFWRYFFWVEHIQRFAAENAQHSAPLWFYLPVLVLGSLPWLGLLPGALAAGWRARQTQPERFLLLCWVVMPLLFFSVAKGKLLTYILPCMAPLALLLAAHGRECAEALRCKVFNANANINTVFALGAIAALLLAGSGMLPCARIYSTGEWPRIVIGTLAFAGWLCFAAVSRRAQGDRWALAALCPLLLSLLVGQIIPQRVIDGNQPQEFIRRHETTLNQSRYVLSNHVGVATALAWELERNDIVMYDDKGELAYGLTYADAQGRHLSREDFPAWLARMRHQGDVALLLLLDRGQDLPPGLPKADMVHRNHRVALLHYQQRP